MKAISGTPALFSVPAPRLPHPQGGWLPQWLAEEIHASSGPRFRTAANWTRCPDCAAVILTGLDDPVIGASATVDPTPLDPYTELACALSSRTTYRLHLNGTTGRIQARDRWNAAIPAGTAGTPPIVPAHHCGRRFTTFILPPQPERTSHGSHRTDLPPF